MIDADTARALIHYEPETGALIWKQRPAIMFEGCARGADREARVWNARMAGKPVGTKKNDGYISVQLLGRMYLAHRLAFLIAHGRWPSDQVDHINGDRTDNRLANLREASPAENCQNTARYKSNKSGFHGVYWHKSGNGWAAHIQVNGQRTYLGLFATPEEAHQAYLSAKSIHHSFQPVPRAAA